MKAGSEFIVGRKTPKIGLGKVPKELKLIPIVILLLISLIFTR